MDLLIAQQHLVQVNTDVLWILIGVISITAIIMVWSAVRSGSSRAGPLSEDEENQLYFTMKKAFARVLKEQDPDSILEEDLEVKVKPKPQPEKKKAKDKDKNDLETGFGNLTMKIPKRRDKPKRRA